ncbi:MAG: hypothetical protein KBA31_15985 [Alphaproteobacteria bacterium]|nr:hypothetical protein [Alphaproteobacteria bacterium]
MRILTFILAAVMGLNGGYMFVDPPGWYAAVPGVPDTGPLNLHFVRDIGLAYVTAGAGLAWSELGGGWRVSALGAMFITLHSLLHVGETFMGHHHGVIVNELLAVHLPAVLAIAVSVFQRRRLN